MSTSSFDEDLVRKLASLLDETGLAEIEYGAADWHIRVTKQAPAPAFVHASAVAAPASASGPLPAQPATDATHPGAVLSPMVGVAYLTPDPDKPTFVKVGDKVSEGQTLLLIEAMKVFNPIHATRGGTVKHILIANGSPVEFGEPLMIIE